MADLLRDKFVCVAINGLYSGPGNSQHVESPTGKPLGTDLREALSQWKRLPDVDRRTATEAQEIKRPPPPPGALVVRVFQRYLKRLPDGEFDRFTAEDAAKIPGWGYGSTINGKPIYNEPMPDTMWLTESEWKSLVPQNGEKGWRYPVPERVRNKIFRYHLANGVTSLPGLWAPESIKSGEITLTVEGGAKGAVRLRLEGSAILNGGSVGYDAKLSGVLEFDPRRQLFSRFDVVAVGIYRGDPKHGEEGIPLGIAFEAADGKSASDLVPPRGMNLKHFADYLEAGKR
jgi:hypothetical protein